jgi:hypothetical protein
MANDYQWLTYRRRSASGRKPRRQWKKTELVELRSLIGRRSLSQLADHFGRDQATVAGKLNRLGYSILQDVVAPLGCNLHELARRVGIPYEVAWHDAHSGHLGAARRNKKDFFVTWSEVRRYERYMGRIRRRRERALARIKEKTISKPQFERMLGLSETHTQRYLKGKVVRAWKIPMLWEDAPRQRWEWHISLADARRVQRLRASGRLKLNQPAYRKLQRLTNAEIVRLRRAKRLGVRDDLRHRLSSVIPGCYTVSQVSSHVGRAQSDIYQHIRMGRLKVIRKRVGNRYYMAIHPSALPPYLAWCQREQLATGPLRPWNKSVLKLHSAGYLTLTEASRRYKVKRSQLAWLKKQLHMRKFAGVWGVKGKEVRTWIKNNHRWRKYGSPAYWRTHARI